jgi:L-malate glycosyltransferase
LAYLIKANRNACENVVFCPENSMLHKYCIIEGLRCETYTRRGIFFVRAAYSLFQLSKRLQVSLIHCHDSHAHTMAIIAATLFGNKIPLVVHRRVDFPVKPGIFSSFKYNHPLVRQFICVSEAIRTILNASLKQAGKSVCIHSSIDLSRFSEVKNKRHILRAELGLKDNEMLIGNTSALAPHKDHFTFIRTATLLRKKFTSMRFVIIGDGPLHKEVQDEIDRNGLTDIIFLAGFRNNVPELLPGLDVFLMTSKTEGLGTSILDAFASGIPVVSTRAGGIPELVEDGLTGLLTDVGDHESLSLAVEQLLNDHDLRNRLIKAAETFVAGFGIREMGQKTMNVYTQILLNETANVK